MAGLMNCGDLTETLERHVQFGVPLSAAEQAHLRACPDCQADLAFLRDLQLALLEDVPEVTPPPGLRAAILAQAGAARPPLADPAVPARPTARPARRWWPAALSAAAVTGVLASLAFLTPSSGVAGVLPDPAVVVSTGRDVLVASNDQGGTLTVLRGDRVQASLTAGGTQTPWFTEGVRLGDRVFLADAANDRVLEVQTEPLQVRRSYAVPDGVAGLSAVSGPGGARVYFKGVRGEVGVLGGAQVTLAHEDGMPLADVMDGVLLLGGQLFVTHHLSGELCALNPDTLSVQRRVILGGMPVALEAYRGDLLVLDVNGRLLRVTPDGRVVQTWAVPGHPDKFSVNDTTAVLSDRAGMMTRVPLTGGPVSQVPMKHPMDVATLPDGTFAVADGGQGLRVLDSGLHTTLTLNAAGQSR
ncbi:hypothetical protein [Deinococcus knuensis]|uniref:Zinc-finger domain-containing protein n=1 Tax=Deinococcus knuensis TaxID=1837380 RepID=A0ABQ2SXB8_9DEIO|nr:hypothetical protein [Deinococcus knuensis]GGS43025.1 hypothetical protein GCM10008961_37680 [Deinococcus knuensis]